MNITQHNKAIVALVMAGVQFTNSFGWTHFGLDEATVTQLVSALSVVLIWAVPNKGAAA